MTEFLDDFYRSAERQCFKSPASLEASEFERLSKLVSGLRWLRSELTELTRLT